MAAEMAVGMAMAQQMMNQTGGLMAQATPGIGRRRRRRRPARRSCSRRRRSRSARRVGEADVMASLDSGDLKGKKIGTQWRVTRAAVDAFLKHG